jgi:hypothetical protein
VPQSPALGFEREVAGVEETDHVLGNIALERLGTAGRKKGSFFPQTASKGGL